VFHSKLVPSLTNTYQSIADLCLKAAGIANENTNSAISFALLIAKAENDSGVTVVVTITRYCIAADKHICTLFLKYSSIGYATLFRFQQVQNYFDTCCLPPSLPVDCE
jgi:hypothetical protein